MLLILQSLILASAAWPVYRLASQALRSDWLGLVFALAYLLYPALHAANLYDFHEIAIAAPLLAWAWYFARQGQWIWFGLFCLLGMSFREEVCNSLFWGWAACWRCAVKRVQTGLLALAGAAAWLLLVMAVSFWQGSVAMTNAMHFREHFDLGDTPAAAFRALLGNPLLAWQRWTDPTKLRYFANMYAPVGPPGALFAGEPLPGAPHAGDVQDERLRPDVLPGPGALQRTAGAVHGHLGRRRCCLAGGAPRTAHEVQTCLLAGIIVGDTPARFRLPFICDCLSCPIRRALPGLRRMNSVLLQPGNCPR